MDNPLDEMRSNLHLSKDTVQMLLHAISVAETFLDVTEGQRMVIMSLGVSDGKKKMEKILERTVFNLEKTEGHHLVVVHDFLSKYVDFYDSSELKLSAKAKLLQEVNKIWREAYLYEFINILEDKTPYINFDLGKEYEELLSLEHAEEEIKLPRFKELVSAMWNVEYFIVFRHFLETKIYVDVSEELVAKSCSYIWQGHDIDKDMEVLLHSLKRDYYIDKTTSKEQLTAIFSGEKLEKIEPIKWLKLPSELLMLITNLKEVDCIENTRRNNYKQMANCFVDSDGKMFNTSFNSLNQTLAISLSPEKQEAIEKLVNKLID